MSERQWLKFILVATLLLGVTYALVTPPFEASDELWHYPMVQHLAQGNSLPVQDPANVGPWKQEASQPPLYYYLGAALTFWIDTSDMGDVRWLNPHVDNGVITPDGNINLAIHDPALSRGQGTLLAVAIIRLASVLLGVATVYLTYRLGKLVAPRRPELAIGAAALNGFTPMFLFISGAVNNDNLALPLTSLTVVVLALQVGSRRRQRETERASLLSMRENAYWLLVGLLVGLAVLTKEGTLALIPLAWGTIFIAEWQAQGRPPEIPGIARAAIWSLARFLWVMLPVLLIAGWWYWRNVLLYGDWLGWSAFLDVLGRRAHPASLSQLWDERWGFLLSYWGLFGGVNVPMPFWIYHVLNALLIVALVGFPVAMWRRWRRREEKETVGGHLGLGRLLHAVETEFPLVLCLLLTGAVIYGVVQWATVTWSSQGRLVFTAISGLNVLLAMGLAGWLPRRLAGIVLTTVCGFMLVVSASAPFTTIRPAYAAERQTDVTLPNAVGVDFGDRMRLASYQVSADRVQPGESVTVWLRWDVLRSMDRDWSVFVHLNDPVLGVPIAQRDMYPGQGLLATRLLKPGDQLLEKYVLTVPATAIAPADLDLVAGLYDLAGGERLPLATGDDSVRLATIRMDGRGGAVPNPISINFENRLRLVGFELSDRRLSAGEPLTLSLFWEASSAIAPDYTFFAQLLGAENHRWAAADVPAPTSTWPVGEPQRVEFTLAPDAGTPADVYPLLVGVYTRTADGGFDRLQTVTPEGRLADDSVRLTLIRVDR
jgi:hypothetical protein